MDDAELSTLTLAELQLRRCSLIDRITSLGGPDDPRVEMNLLRDLTFVTRSLRRKNAGPPRAATSTKRSAKQSLDSMLDI